MEESILRKIDIPDIEDIARGAALLGAGGGGDPYIGKLVAVGAIKECGPVTLLDPDEVPGMPCPCRHNLPEAGQASPLLQWEAWNSVLLLP